MKINTAELKTICINCLGLIGDVLIRAPFIECIAQRCPQASITVIVEPGRDILLRNHPDIDHIIIFNRNKTPRLPYLKNLWNLIRTLRKNKYDLFINLYGGGSSAGITRLSNAKHRFGFFYKKKHAAAYTYGLPHPLFTEHWGKSFGILLAPLGITNKDLRAGTTFIPSQKALISADDIMWESASPWVLINLGAGDIRKIWPIKNQVSLAKWLVEKYHYHLGVFINPGQEFLAREFSQLYGSSQDVTYLDKLSLDVIGALMSKSTFVITGDTGLLHLCFGVKTPSVALFTYTRPEQVLPEDCICIPCFIEDPNLINDHGVRGGKLDIPIATEGAKIIQ
jgi:ADP-heptose:LPS heptosyltransferase